MTEEEIAEEYVCNKADKGNFDLEQFGKAYFSESSMKQAFLAGLKVGKPKWHKVADGDLPNTEREVLVFMWGSYYLGYYKQYDGEDRSWHFEDFDEESKQVIAWCEIPQFKE